MKLRITAIFIIPLLLSACEGEQISLCLESSLCDIQFYPNPFESEANISFMSNSKEVAKLSVTSLSGQILYEDQVELIQGDNLINRSFKELNSGIYILSIEVDEEIQHQRIVKK